MEGEIKVFDVAKHWKQVMRMYFKANSRGRFPSVIIRNNANCKQTRTVL